MAGDRQARTSSSPPPFPTYLLPSLDGAWRKKTPACSRDAAAAAGAAAAGRHTRLSATGTSTSSPDTLRCVTCSSDIAFCAQIVSKGFTGRHGRAFLVGPPLLGAGTAACPGIDCRGGGGETGLGDLVNVRVGRPETRQLVTGAHVVADIACVVCGTKLGWKYVDAREPSQQYKVGKFILETHRVVPHRSWEHVWGGDGAHADACTSQDDDEVVVFDSDDDDECEAVFAATWDAAAVAGRRRDGGA